MQQQPSASHPRLGENLNAGISAVPQRPSPLSGHRARKRLVTRSSLPLAFGLIASAVDASLLPTEIYYNGPLPGSDPDEFLELTNSGPGDIALEGFSFSDGLDLVFPNLSIASGESLIVAPNPTGFATAFPSFLGTVLDARGGLSNSGEALTLIDLNGAVVFQLTYDDGGDWAASADGVGDSLQLIPSSVDLNDPFSWEAGTPSPGDWRGLAFNEPPVEGPPVDPVAAVAPATMPLLLGGLASLFGFRRRSQCRSKCSSS